MIFPPLILFLIILSFLVFIHELGHFYFARRFGVRVEEFGIGIPPRAWYKKYKDTIYSLNWLPFGGFVKIKGEDFEEFDPEDETNFINKKPWQKSIILLAGVFMNLLFAVGIFYFILGTNEFKSSPLILIGDYEFPLGNTVQLPNVVTFIEDDTPAAKGGIQFGDRIVALSYEDNMVETGTVEDIRNFVTDKADKEITVFAENVNTKETAEYKVTPVYNETIQQPALGVQLGEAIELTYQTPVQKSFSGFLHAGNVSSYSFYILSHLIGQSVESGDVRPVASGVSGPVGIFGVVKAVLEHGGPRAFIAILDLTALFSLSLAIMNLLPIPALDGGRFIFVLMEWISGKRPSQKLEARAHQLGYAFLMGLIVLITIKDVWQLIVF